MKTNKIIAAALVLCGIVACNSQQKSVTVDGTTYSLPEKGLVDSTSYLLGINFGSFLKQYDFGGDLNYSLIEKGMTDFVNAEGDQMDPAFLEQFKINPELMNDVFNSFLEKRNNYTSALNKMEQKTFLDENAKKAGVQVTESGLQYKIIEAGNGNKPTPADTVFVYYKGTLPDGTVFDETPEGSAPISFTLDRVISGWTEGLQLIGEGGKINLVIPSDLAYGDRGTQGIPASTPLTFDVELLEVRPFIAE